MLSVADPLASKSLKSTSCEQVDLANIWRCVSMNLRSLVTASCASGLLVCLLAGCASAQVGSSIAGFVYGQGRSPVPDVFVELNTELGRTLTRTKTDSAGRYMFRGVPFGRVYVRVLALGTNYEEQTQSIEVGDVGPRGQVIPDSVQLDFHLRPRKEDRKAVNAVVFVQEVPEEAKKLYQDGIAELDRQRSAEAIQLIQRAIDIFPTYFDALERLGQEFIKEQKFEDAVQMFSRSTAVNAQNFSSWYNLAYASYQVGKFPAAIDAAGRALSLNKAAPHVLFVLGVSQRRVGRYSDAEKSLLEAGKLDKGKTPEIYWQTALLYTYNLKRYQEAADQLELYLKADPKNPKAEEIRRVIARLRENRLPSD